MEIICTMFAIAFVVLIGYYCMKESDEDRRDKEKAQAFIARMQAEQARAVAAEYERQRVKPAAPSRSAPITTGKPASVSAPATQRSGSTTKVTTEVKRHDNSFDDGLDTYTTPTYHSSHSSGSYSSHSSCSSSTSSDSSSSSSDSSSSSSCD